MDIIGGNERFILKIEVRIANYFLSAWWFTEEKPDERSFTEARQDKGKQADDNLGNWS